MHVIQLRFKLKAQLHFFLMVFGVLGKILFQFYPQLLFIGTFTLKFFSILGQGIVGIS